MRITAIQNDASDGIKSVALKETENQITKNEKESSIFAPVKEEINEFNQKAEKKQLEAKMLKELGKIDDCKGVAALLGALVGTIIAIKFSRKAFPMGEPVEFVAAAFGGAAGFVGTILAGNLVAAPFKYNIMKKEYADVTKDNEKYQGSNFWGHVFMFSDSDKETATTKQNNHKK